MANWVKIYAVCALLYLEDEEEEENMQTTLYLMERSPTLWRRRWDSKYLIDLAEEEESFLGEYRMDPKSFDVLVQVLGPSLDVNA